MLVKVRSATAECAAYSRDLGFEADVDYAVYGIEISEHGSRYLLAGDESFSWLVQYPTHCCEVIDDERSIAWVSQRSTIAPDWTIIGPPALTDDTFFLEHLADGDAEAQALFLGWRAENADFSKEEGASRMAVLLDRLRAGLLLPSTLTVGDVEFARRRGWGNPAAIAELASGSRPTANTTRTAAAASSLDSDRAQTVPLSTGTHVHALAASRKVWAELLNPPSNP